MPLATMRRDHGEVTMATKTVVCPECGSQTALGRFTCVECGAFLDGIAVQRVASPPAAAAPPAPDARDGNEETAPDDDPAAGATTAVGPWREDDQPAAEPVDPTGPPAGEPAPRVEWPRSPGPAPLPVPEPRVPAGSWLPPSAELTGLEEPTLAGTGGAATAVLAPPAAARAPRDWLAVVGAPERRWAAARRTIAIGGVVGLFGVLLPWGSGSLGNLLNVWLNVWGLAFPGVWLIALGLVAMVGLAVLGGAAERVPLGVPAVALSSLQLGLIWSALFGAANRPIGVLVVLVGAIVLLVGGLLQLGPRHEAATPDV